MIFRIQATEVAESLIGDTFMDDSLEYMPGGWVIPYRQLRAYRNQEDFFVFDSYEKKVHIKYSSEVVEAFNWYYRIWEDYHYFGLRGVLGVAGDPQGWVLDFLKYFERIYQEIESYRMKRNSN